MNQDDLFHVLKDLVELYRMGGLTQGEFQETKKLLLSQLRSSSAFSSQTDLFGPMQGESSGSLSQGSFEEAQAPSASFSSVVSASGEGSYSQLPHSLTPAISIGQWLMNRYEIRRFLGEGPSGQVFLTYDSIRQNEYALKWIHPHLVQIPFVREQFLNQLKENEKLSHPGFVRTYSFERENALLFYTMEFVDGITLDHAFSRTRPIAGEPFLPVTFTLRLLEQTIELLSFAHSQGLIHRNLKPSNIGLMKQGEVKIMDAGIAKAVEDAVTSRHTSFGGVVYYMAPEQIQRRGTISSAADVYSLGAITYQLLTGELPMGALVAPSQYVHALPSEVDGIIMRALEPRPTHRYPTPQAFWGPLCKVLAPLVAKEQIPSQSLYSLLLSYLPPEADNEFPSHPPLPEEDAGTTNEEVQVIQVAHHDLPQDVASPPDTVSPTSTDLPMARSYPTSSLLPRRARSRPITEDTDAEVPQVLAEKEISVDDLDISAGWERRYDPNDEMISLERGPTPAPPSNIKRKGQLTNTSDLSSEISRISAISSLAVAPIAQELELELEDEGPPGPSPEDIQRRALELPPPPNGLKESTLHAKDGTPLVKMVCIPAGPFMMGSVDSDPLASTSEIPQREVQLEEYWVARTPITNRMWSKFMSESGYYSDEPDYLRHWIGGRPSIDKLEHPVVFISAEDAEAFCRFYELSLPSEAQWEKASRGDNGQIWPWGNKKPHSGNCNFLGSNIHNTTPVAAYFSGVSPYGLFDCCGNAWEWCRDTWEREWLKKMGEAAKDPVHQDDAVAFRSIRGGCFRNYGRGVRCATRHYAVERAAHLCFRPVRVTS